MPAPSKIQDETEVIRWMEQGWTYQQIVDEYRRKYNIDTTLSMWSNFRRRRGLDRRYSRDETLVPWEIEKRHRNSYHLAMLRAEARRRGGFEMRQSDLKRLESWLQDVRELNAVVHYDPETPDGFYLVPREKADGDDLIRQPKRGLTRRRRAD